MSPKMKNGLLVVIAVCMLVIAAVEISGVSKYALLNRFDDATQKRLAEQQEHIDRSLRAETMPKTEISFAEKDFDFGRISAGAVVTHTYKFKNTGAGPLLIVKADASCGCTVPSFPKAPVPPGGEGAIQVQFNSKGRSGMQHKTIMVVSNAQEKLVHLHFNAEVIDRND